MQSACDARCDDLLQLEHQLRLLGDALGVDLAFDQYTRARLAFRNKVTRVIRKMTAFVKADPLINIPPLLSQRCAALGSQGVGKS